MAGVRDTITPSSTPENEREKTSDTASPALSIVVPCFNEEDVLGELHRRVTTAARESVGESFELLLIDDGSRDRTRARIEMLAAVSPQTTGIFLSRNHGHQRALTAGLAYCRGARILVIDADLQDPPELLGEMMQMMDKGADVVYGQRRRRQGETLSKRLSAKLFYRFLSWMSEVDIPLDTGDFRLMSRAVVDHLNAMPEDDRFIRGMVSWLGFRQEAMHYDRAERYAGETKYPLHMMVRLAIDAVTGFSIVPLRLATFLAAIVACLSCIMILYVLIQSVLGNVVPGWTSVMMVVLIASSVQLFAIGILGEYLGRLYMQSKNRPTYVVERIVTGAPDTD